MIPIQLKDFIIRVTEKTETNSLHWNEGYDDSFFCENKNVTLHLSNGYDDIRDTYFYAFKIVIGNQVTPFSVGSNEEDYIVMKRLYEAVIISANNITNELNSFFD